MNMRGIAVKTLPRG